VNVERVASGFDLFVPGKPATKGSAKAFMRPGMKHPVITNDNPRAKSWEAIIRETIRLQVASDRLLIELPAEVRIAARFHRPKNHYRSGKHERDLRPDAPRRMTEKPDGDKVLRSVLDALTGVAYLDDKQVCNAWMLKTWADRWTEPEGVRIVVDYWREVGTLAARMGREVAGA
jgi:Holliday junction resolvase RusA-like endonuclease